MYVEYIEPGFKPIVGMMFLVMCVAIERAVSK